MARVLEDKSGLWELQEELLKEVGVRCGPSRILLFWDITP